MTLLLSTALLLGQASPALFQFKGGSQADLCTYIAAYSKGPVVMVAERPQRWPQATFDPGNGIELARGLRRTLGVDRNGARMALHRGYPAFILHDGSRHLAVDFFPPPKVTPAFANGNVSVSASSGPRLLTELLPPDLAGRVDVHWFIGEVRLLAEGRNVPEREWLDLLADAAGAKVKPLPRNRYRLELDVVEFRKRLKRVFADIEMGKQEFPFGEQALLAKTYLDQINDAKLAKAMSRPYWDKVPPELSLSTANNPAIRTAALTYLKKVRVGSFEGSPEQFQLASKFQDLMKRVSWRKAPEVYWRGPISATLLLFGTEPDGKPFEFHL